MFAIGFSRHRRARHPTASRVRTLIAAGWGLLELATPVFGQTAATPPVPPPNLTDDFEVGSVGDPPLEWFTPAAGCTTKLTDENPKQGKQCVQLSGTPTWDNHGSPPFGNFMRSIDAAPFRSKRVRLRAAVRVQMDPKARAQLWLREDRGKQMGFFDNMGNRPIRSFDWEYFEITGDIGAEATKLNFGLITMDGTTAWLDDVTLQAIAEIHYDPPEPARPLSDRGLANLVAFTRLLGYVRYFHPSDEAAKTDWEELAIRGVRAVEGAESPAALVAALQGQFQLLAPSVQIFLPKKRPKILASKQGDAGRAIGPAAENGALQVTMWRHHGVGCNSDSFYTSNRIASALVDGTLPEGYHDPNQPFFANLGGGVACLVPLAVFADGNGTLPRGEAEPTATTPATVFVHTGLDRGTRLADVALAWNVFEHFYPYFDVVKTDWSRELPVALRQAAIDADEREFLDTLRRLVAALHDGHGLVNQASDIGRWAPAIQWTWVKDQLVVTQVADSLTAACPALRPGAIVFSIDGRRVDDAWHRVERLHSSATPQYARYQGLHELLRGAEKSVLKLDLKSEGKTRSVALTRGVRAGTQTESRPDRVSQIQPGIWYVDLSRLMDGDITGAIDTLAAARGVVFDMRGYPGNKEAWKVLGYAAQDTLRSAQWLIPRVTWPDHDKMAFDQSGWPVAPKEPRLRGKLAFLIDGRAISAAETFMGIVEAYKLGAIVGEPTAGTNGNINPFVLPGEYRISWTGMKVLKQDGSRHHGVGIHPTVPVSRTVAGIAAGRDEQLEAALDLVGR